MSNPTNHGELCLEKITNNNVIEQTVVSDSVIFDHLFTNVAKTQLVIFNKIEKI